MVDVRRATPADADALVQLVLPLHQESPQHCDEPIDVAVGRRWFAERAAPGFLADDNAVFVAEADGHPVGVLVALIIQRWFSRRRVAAEMLFYVRPQNRGGFAFRKLVRAYKSWAKAQGATKATLGISTGIDVRRTVHAYQREGFTLDGHNLSTDL